MADFLTTLQKLRERRGETFPTRREARRLGRPRAITRSPPGRGRSSAGWPMRRRPFRRRRNSRTPSPRRSPMKRWAPETLTYLRNNGFSLEPQGDARGQYRRQPWRLGTAPSCHTLRPPARRLNTIRKPPAAAAGAPNSAAGAPAAPAATPAPGTTLPGFQPGSPAAKMAEQGLKTLGLGQGGQGGQGGGAGEDEPPKIQPPPMVPAQAVGGAMMMGPGGQNTMGQRLAEQALAQQRASSPSPRSPRSPPACPSSR